MGGRAIMPAIVSYMSARAGTPIALDQLATGIGAEPNRVQKALANAIGQGVYGDALQCLHRGQVWVWRGGGPASPVGAPTPAPAPAPNPRTAPTMQPAPEPTRKVLARGDMVEVMGVTQNGDAVASDENGQLYRVVPL